MHIDLIDSRPQFATLQENWTALYRQDPSANVFMSWCWLKQLYARRPEPVRILAVRMSADDQNHVAFLPLRHRLLIDRKRSRFVESYALAGNDWADQTGLLCSPDIEQEVIKVLTTALAEMPWRSLSFFDMSMSDNRYAQWLAQFSRLEYAVESQYLTDNNAETRLDIAPCVALPESFEQYLDSLSANTRQRLRRYGRSLNESKSLRIGFSSDATHAQNLTWFVRFWKKRWLSSKGSRTDTLALKYRKILEQGLEDGNLVLVIMHQSDTPVAMIACYLDEIHKTVSFFVAARDLEFKAIPSGLVLHSYMIQWAIANNYQRYHLLRGDEPYKYSLGGVDQPVYSIRVRRRNAVEKTHFLSVECRADALEKLAHVGEQFELSQKHRLYAHLLECWPNDVQTLTHYKNWLTEIGDQDHADSIQSALLTTEPACPPSESCACLLPLSSVDQEGEAGAGAGADKDSTGMQTADSIAHRPSVSRLAVVGDVEPLGQ